MPARDDLPSTLERSPKKARDTWMKAHDSAVRTYGEGRRAHQTALAALKRSFEKVGDHWEPKRKKGPSDRRAATGAGGPPPRAAGGVDASASKEHLYQVAQKLGIKGRSLMNKPQLIDAIRRENRRESARSRTRR